MYALTNRRDFVVAAAGGFFAMLGVPRPKSHHTSHDMAQGGSHPDPRPDVDASNVLTEEDLAGYSHVVELYNGIREIPHIADGIRCQCGCADVPGYRSLLTCFEAEGMAKWCEICQTEGRMVVRLHAAGRTLDQIREAVDARF
jgi:hypothetical protein